MWCIGLCLAFLRRLRASFFFCFLANNCSLICYHKHLFVSSLLEHLFFRVPFMSLHCLLYSLLCRFCLRNRLFQIINRPFYRLVSFACLKIFGNIVEAVSFLVQNRFRETCRPFKQRQNRTKRGSSFFVRFNHSFGVLLCLLCKSKAAFRSPILSRLIQICSHKQIFGFSCVFSCSSSSFRV